MEDATASLNHEDGSVLSVARSMHSARGIYGLQPDGSEVTWKGQSFSSIELWGQPVRTKRQGSSLRTRWGPCKDDVAVGIAGPNVAEASLQELAIARMKFYDGFLSTRGVFEAVRGSAVDTGFFPLCSPLVPPSTTTFDRSHFKIHMMRAHPDQYAAILLGELCPDDVAVFNDIRIW